MKIPPPVAYPTGALTVEGWITALMASVWLLVQAVWGWHLWAASADLPASWWVALLSGAGWLLWNVWRLKVSPSGELRWSLAPVSSQAMTPAGVWIWTSPAWRRGLVLSEVHCTLDLDRLMVLHLRSSTGLGFWVWCHAAQAPSDWLAFRRVVHADRHKDLHITQPASRN